MCSYVHIAKFSSDKPWIAMSLCWVLRTVALSSLISASSALVWSSSSEVGDITQSCAGDDISLPWSFTSSPAETIIYITWFLERSDGNRTVFASLTRGEFFSHKENVQFVPSAGLQIQNVTVMDTGLYSVQVDTVDVTGHMTMSNRSAFLEVSDPPVLSGNQLIARRRTSPVRDEVTGSWYVSLECGHFTDLGQPPVLVEWTAPSGAVYADFNYKDGYFLFPLKSVESGNYTCSLLYQSPARRCLANDSVLLDEASAYVDEEIVKVTVIEALQNDLIEEMEKVNRNRSQENEALRQENWELKSQVQNLTQSVHNINGILTQEDENIKALKSQIENLTQSIHNINGILTKENEDNKALKSRVQNLTQTVNFLVQNCQDIRGIALQPTGCADPKLHGSSSGIRLLFQELLTIWAYCDQATDGGGWTVFQRRQDGSVDFYRDWTEYRKGFGNLSGEFWLGLDNLHQLTSGRRYDLRVDLEDFNGTQAFATYSGFRIDDINSNYTLYFDNFTGGDAGDSLRLHNGHAFETRDHERQATRCSETYHGAWWYNFCHESNLNAVYSLTVPLTVKGDGILWYTFGGTTIPLKRTEMKIRPS